MKRSIICLYCEEKHKRENQSFPGEHIKWLQGYAKKDMVCDFCNTSIPKRWLCSAESIWTDQLADYYPWESEFISQAHIIGGE